MRKSKKTLLWEIRQAEGSAGPSYLFGTMHVQDERAFAFKELAYEKIRECQRLALEFDLGEMAGGALPTALRLPANKTLSSLMTPQQFTKLRRVIRRAAGIDLAHFQRLSPILASNLISEQILSRDMELSLDEHLWKFALQEGIAVTGIETYQEQLEVLQQIPLEQQAKSLIWMGRHISRFRQKILQMADVYQEGDIYRLYRLAKRSTSGLRPLLLYRRNVIMAERIAQMVREHRVFCAIGAGHLAGGKGVIRLLKQAGFQLRPVSRK